MRKRNPKKPARKAAAKPVPKPTGRPLAVESEEVVAAALRECKGFIYITARRLKVSTRTIESYLNRWPGLREILEEEQGEFLDMGELGLYGAVQKGQPWAICFLLKTRGQKRGYIQKQQIFHGEVGATEVEEEVLASRSAHEGEDPTHPPAG